MLSSCAKVLYLRNLVCRREMSFHVPMCQCDHVPMRISLKHCLSQPNMAKVHQCFYHGMVHVASYFVQY